MIIDDLITGDQTKTVLVTGGGGSLGRAFVNLLRKNYRVLALDNNEWAIAELRKEKNVETMLMDYVDFDFDTNPVDYVIHCAAYKHVGLGESNPTAFVENNIFKVDVFFQNMYRRAIPYVFISSDKAVSPVGLYGATKMVGERLAQRYGGAVARLGNILNSSGSVIPLWEEAIKKGEPIQVTDERMMRFFIEDYEAVMQIWDKFKSGEKLIIPNCTEIRLLDLLTLVLQRHGYKKASDYKPGVVMTGMKKGEKLREVLKWEWEV